MTDTSLEAMLDSAPTTDRVQPDVKTQEAQPSPAETGDKPTDTAPPAEVESQSKPTEKLVPLKAVEDERRKRQELEKRIAEFEAKFAQKPQEPVQAPDWDLDPRSAAAHLAAEMQRRTFTMAVEMSERVLKQQHPDYEEVRNVFAEAAKADPRLAMELVNHPFPAEFAYEQGKRLRMLQEIGDDPESYKARLREELMAELRSQGAAPAQPPAPRQSAPVPKSLARAPSATAQTRDPRGRFAPSDDGPTPLEDIIG
jgi:hypothetical protein